MLIGNVRNENPVDPRRVNQRGRATVHDSIVSPDWRYCANWRWRPCQIGVELFIEVVVRRKGRDGMLELEMGVGDDRQGTGRASHPRC